MAARGDVACQCFDQAVARSNARVDRFRGHTDGTFLDFIQRLADGQQHLADDVVPRITIEAQYHKVECRALYGGTKIKERACVREDKGSKTKSSLDRWIERSDWLKRLVRVKMWTSMQWGRSLIEFACSGRLLPATGSPRCRRKWSLRRRRDWGCDAVRGSWLCAACRAAVAAWRTDRWIPCWNREQVGRYTWRRLCSTCCAQRHTCDAHTWAKNQREIFAFLNFPGRTFD